jgi:hypothetical protein
MAQMLLRRDPAHLEKYIDYLAYQPQSFTEATPLLSGGRHVLIDGITGAGKTALMLYLLREFYEEGFRILLRDAGGLEFINLALEIPVVMWIPEGCSFRLEEPQEALDNLEVAMFRDPSEIVQEAFKGSKRFHVACNRMFHPRDYEQWVEFFGGLLGEILHLCHFEPPSRARRLVLAVDELNDLVTSSQYALSPLHRSLKAVIEMNLRSLRKHYVTLMASTHGLTQISRGARSQFSYVFLKRHFGDELYQFCSRNLTTVRNEVFWFVLNALQRLPPDEAFLFDPVRRFDRVCFPNPLVYERDEMRWEASPPAEPVRARRFDEIDLLIAAARTRTELSFRELEARTGLSKSTIHERYRKLREVPLLKEVMG